MGLAENIKTARKALKMSQDELAEAIGANRVTISRYETGSYLPSVPALQKLAEALRTTPSQLTGTTEPETDPPKTKEARIVSAGIDRMPPDKREVALNLLKTVYAEYFEKEEDKFA